MKIWKAKEGKAISEDSEVVFNFTGNTKLEPDPPKAQPFDLNTPTVMYIPGKGTVVNVEGEDLSNTKLKHVDKTTQVDITKNLDYSFHHARQIHDVHIGAEGVQPDYYMLAHTDTLTKPPKGKDESSWSGKGKNFTYIERIVRWLLPYEDYKGSRLVQSFAHSAHPDTFYSHDAKMFAEDMLLPALMDSDELLPKEAVKQKLDNLTLVGYSHGSIFFKELENYLHEKLTEMGQGEEDIKDMLKHVVTINAPSVSRVLHTKNLFTGFYAEARLDVLRRHVQTLDVQEARGIMGKLNDGNFNELRTAIKTKNGKTADVFQRQSDGNITAKLFGAKIPETLLNGFSDEFKEYHAWQGLEIRDWVGDAEKMQKVPNGAIILHDAPNEFIECESLEQVYADEPPEGAATKPNQLHHEIGGALWSHQEEQCVPLLFNRLLHNAMERGKERGGIDFDENDNHVRAMLDTTPQHDMTPEHMKKTLEARLNRANEIGNAVPIRHKASAIENESGMPMREVAARMMGTDASFSPEYNMSQAATVSKEVGLPMNKVHEVERDMQRVAKGNTSHKEVRTI